MSQERGWHDRDLGLLAANLAGRAHEATLNEAARLRTSIKGVRVAISEASDSTATRSLICALSYFEFQTEEDDQPSMKGGSILVLDVLGVRFGKSVLPLIVVWTTLTRLSTEAQ